MGDYLPRVLCEQRPGPGGRADADEWGGRNHHPHHALIERLGWAFNSAVGLYIDAYAASYVSDHGGIEFMMPVKPRSPRARFP